MSSTLRGKKSTLENQECLARRVRNYWHERGFPQVKTWIEERSIPHPNGGFITHYEIRSNLVNGNPPHV